MSDIVSSVPLLAAAPLRGDWGDPNRLPLAVLPCLGGLELGVRTAFREEE